MKKKSKNSTNKRKDIQDLGYSEITIKQLYYLKKFLSTKSFQNGKT